MDFNSSNLAWNKSFSAPDISTSGPLFRRVVIEECYYPNNHAMSSMKTPAILSSQGQFPHDNQFRVARHISCDQLASFSRVPNQNISNIWTDSTITSTPVQSPMAKASLNTEEIVDDSPMDVDSFNKTLETSPSRSSPKKPNILDYVDLTYQGSTAILKKKQTKMHKRLSKKAKTKGSSMMKDKSKYFRMKMAIAVLVVIIGIPIYDKINYNRNIDVESFINDLSNFLIGQDQVIQQFADALYRFNNGSNLPERHLLSLIGTTGVGKSLSVNLIKRQFMPKQIIEVDIDKFDLSHDSLSIYKTVPYLVIFEDLTYEKMPKLIHILNILQSDKWILVVTIFNIQETEDIKTFTVNHDLYEMIPQELHSLDYHYENINFQSFNENFLRDHINSFGSIYSEFVYNINNWKDLVSQHDFERFGFKGLLEKMQLSTK